MAKEVESTKVTLKSEREHYRHHAAQLSSELREETSKKSEAEKMLSRLETRLSATEDRRRTAEEAKTAAQTSLLEKIEAEKSLRGIIGKMEKDIQRLIISRSSQNGDFDDDDGSGGGGIRGKNDGASTTSKGKAQRRLIRSCDRFENSSTPRSTNAAMTSEELSLLKKEVDEDLKKMFQDGDEKKRKKT